MPPLFSHEPEALQVEHVVAAQALVAARGRHLLAADDANAVRAGQVLLGCVRQLVQAGSDLCIHGRAVARGGSQVQQFWAWALEWANVQIRLVLKIEGCTRRESQDECLHFWAVATQTVIIRPATRST